MMKGLVKLYITSNIEVTSLKMCLKRVYAHRVTHILS